LGDVLRGGQAQVLPGPAAVGALVHPVPETDAALRLVLAGPQPDDVRVVGVERDAAEGVGAVVVEDGLPALAGVGRFPQAAGGDGDVPHLAVARVHGDVADTAR